MYELRPLKMYSQPADARNLLELEKSNATPETIFDILSIEIISRQLESPGNVLSPFNSCIQKIIKMEPIRY